MFDPRFVSLPLYEWSGVDNFDTGHIRDNLKPQSEQLLEKWRLEREQTIREMKECAAKVAEYTAKGAVVVTVGPVVLAGAGVYYGTKGALKLGKGALNLFRKKR